MFHPSTSLLPGVLATFLVTAAPHAPEASASLPAEHVFEAGEHQIATLIDQVATALGRNYLYNPAEISAQTTIRLQSRLVVQEPDLEPTLARLLFTKDLHIVQLAPELDIAEVISRQGPRREEVDARAVFVAPDDISAHSHRVDVVTTAYQLQHISAIQFATQMRPFFAASTPNALTVGSIAENTVVLRGTRRSVAAALALARRADEAMARSAERAEVETLRRRVEELESPAKTESGR